MALSSRITLYDGTTTVNIDARATLSLDIGIRSAGGASNLRLANGSINRQVAWEKDLVTVTARGWMPPGLDAIDWSQQLTLTIPSPGGTTQYQGYADRPQETRTAAAAIDCTWVLNLEVG